MKFEDKNADGTKDAGESGPAVSFDVKIFRDNGATPGQLDGTDTLVDTVPTAAGTGAWSKTGLKPDSYVVCEVQKMNWTQSKPDPSTSPVCGAPTTGNASGGGYAETLISGQDRQNVDFGNYRNATIKATKYEDNNANGRRRRG